MNQVTYSSLFQENYLFFIIYMNFVNFFYIF